MHTVTLIPHLKERKTQLEPDAMRAMMFVDMTNRHQRGASIMKQGVLPFQYEEEKSSTGMTALSGLPAYLELAQAAGLRSSIERHGGSVQQLSWPC